MGSIQTLYSYSNVTVQTPQIVSIGDSVASPNDTIIVPYSIYAPGDLLLMFVHCLATSFPSPATGWTIIHQAANTVDTQNVTFYAAFVANDGSVPSNNVPTTLGVGNGALAKMITIRGVKNTGNVADAIGENFITVQAAAPFDAPNPTIVERNTLVLAHCSTRPSTFGAQAIPTSPSMVEVYDSGGAGNALNTTLASYESTPAEVGNTLSIGAFSNPYDTSAIVGTITVRAGPAIHDRNYIDTDPLISITADSVARTATLGGWKFYAGGHIKSLQATSVSSVNYTDEGDWHDFSFSGSLYEIRATVQSGAVYAPFSSATATWLSLADDHIWGTTGTLSILVEIRNASTLAVIDSAIYSVT